MSASSSTARPTFFGLFDRPATPELDIEAQLPQPTPIRTSIPRAQSLYFDEPATNPVDTFFGVSHASSSRRTLSLTGTRDSRHDEISQSISVESEAPPSYADSLEPPAYSQVSDQPTLAMYLFKFGFLFPLFWLAGSLILLSPLRAPEDWETSKPEFERQELIESMRRTELKWARRCLVALIISTLLILAIAISVFLIMRS
ncbi:hypothetical protein L227DRAFT_584938 [Lentinus tigrinus ALCF2SS1-6]|uniref:Transmembrane protein n=1 Tax=Lentinus tigrinus ALCF2SS1-6 TaxID=1328759 RepID=A0A5C2SHL6_9APHY|nr:hypothetical protein L227DRAFT_584938 [Lentinus tigrinus ALCF2SS1-6]